MFMLLESITSRFHLPVMEAESPLPRAQISSAADRGSRI